VGVSRDGANLFSTPYYLKNARSYELQIWQAYLQRLSNQKAFKNLGEKGALAYPGTCQFFKIPPIISGKPKATNFKFGKYIHSVHANKRPVKI